MIEIENLKFKEGRVKEGLELESLLMKIWEGFRVISFGEN